MPRGFNVCCLSCIGTSRSVRADMARPLVAQHVAAFWKLGLIFVNSLGGAAMKRYCKEVLLPKHSGSAITASSPSIVQEKPALYSSQATCFRCRAQICWKLHVGAALRTAILARPLQRHKKNQAELQHTLGHAKLADIWVINPRHIPLHISSCAQAPGMAAQPAAQRHHSLLPAASSPASLPLISSGSSPPNASSKS